MASRIARRAAPAVRHAVEPARRHARRIVTSEHASRSEVIAGVFAALVYWVGIVASMLGAAASRVRRDSNLSGFR